jgi:hypothetical protein
VLGCEGCGKRGHSAAQCGHQNHPNWSTQFATVLFKDSAIGKAIKSLADGNVRSLLPDGVQWVPEGNYWTRGDKLQSWLDKIRGPSISAAPAASSAQGNRSDQHRGKRFHLGVVRGGKDVYPSVQGTLTSTSTDASTEHITVECLLDTGCLFANSIKADMARRLGPHTKSAENKRLITLADGSLTSSVGYVCCDVTFKQHGNSMILKSILLHMLPGLAFDVILGFPCIRKYNLTVNYSSLFSENNLQVHNCTKCRQCLPKVFQQECPPSDGETQPEVLLAVPCVSTLNPLREPCRVPSGPEVKARRSDQPGGYASAPRGMISDRKTSDLASERLPWTTGATECVSGRDHPSGRALALPGTTGSTECGFDVMVKQARDRQFEYLNAQQGVLEDESGDEFWSNPLRGRDPKEMSDLVPMRCEVHTGPVDIDGTLMQISISGSADLQRNIRSLCAEYVDIFSPTVRQEPARVPPLSMKVDSDKWKDRRNRLFPRFLTRDKDDDLRKQVALLESLGVIEKFTASEYSQVHLVRKPENSWRLCIDFKTLNDATESLETWPLQNIPIMVDRVTQHRPRLYGKVDMTSGFFQTAIDERSRPFTAFITFTGLFQWCRLPMGLKDAASYFQRMMASVVLAGLLYIFVELYLDDVLVYATNDEEFLERLRIVFERFRQFNMLLWARGGRVCGPRS